MISDITVRRYIWECKICGNIQNEYGGLLPGLTCQLCGANHTRGKIANEQQEVTMNNEQKEKVIAAMLKDEEIKKIYDAYIIKSIPLETWVRNTVDYLLTHTKIEGVGTHDR